MCEIIIYREDGAICRTVATQINPPSPPLSCNEVVWKYVYICVNALVKER